MDSVPMAKPRGVAFFIGAVIFAAVMLLAFVQFTGDHTRSDFMIFYSAGRIVLDGQGARLYTVGPQAGSAGWYNHAPAEALLFVPFARFSYSTAFFLWLCVNLILLASCVFLLRAWLARLSTWELLLLIALAFLPLLAVLWAGQDSLVSLLIYTIAFRAFESGKKFSAGAVLALGLFKPQLILPFALLAVVRYGRKFFAGFALGSAGFFLLSVAAAGLRTTLRFPLVLASYGRATTFSGFRGFHPFPGVMLNLRGLVYSVFSSCCRERTDLDLAVLFISFLVLVAAIAAQRKIDFVFPEAFAFDLSVTLLVSWHLLAHDFILASIPILLLLPWTRDERALHAQH